jgi:hypothetical protein
MPFPDELDNLPTAYANETEMEDIHPPLHNAVNDAINRMQTHALTLPTADDIADLDARLDPLESLFVGGRLGFPGSDMSLGDFDGGVSEWSIEGEFPYFVFAPDGSGVPSGSGLELRSAPGYEDPLVGFFVSDEQDGVILYSLAGDFVHLTPSAGGAAKAGLLFGPLLDVNLYRDAVDVLKTDDSLEVGGDLTVDGDILGPTIDTLASAIVTKADESVLMRDRFTDVAGTLITAHAMDSGHAWALHGAENAFTPVISDANRLRQGAAVAGSAAASPMTPALTERDYVVGVVGELLTDSGIGTGPFIGLWARLDPVAVTGYLMQHHAGQFTIWRATAGVFTSILTSNRSWGDAIHVEFEVVGDSPVVLNVRRNGLLIMSSEDSGGGVTAAHLVPGRAGMRWGSGGGGGDTNATGKHADSFYVRKFNPYA